MRRPDGGSEGGPAASTDGERICAAALDGSPTAVERPPTGRSKRTALVTLADGREWAVQYVPNDAPRADRGSRAAARGADGHPLAAEAAVARVLADRTAVPVPAVLADGTLADPPVAYLVTERVRGADLHGRFTDLPAGSRESLAGTLGRYLAAVHEAVRFDVPGRMAVRDGDLAVPAPLPGGAFYREYLEAGLADWPDALAPLEPVVREALDGRLDDLPADPRLFPWDYRPGNVVVEDPDTHTGAEATPTPVVTGVLDWGEPLAADPGLSVAKAEYTLADWYVRSAVDVAALRTAFREGYREIRPFPETDYDAFRLLGIVDSAADGAGRVTRPRYPTVDADAAVAFHRERIEATAARL